MRLLVSSSRPDRTLSVPLRVGDPDRPPAPPRPSSTSSSPSPGTTGEANRRQIPFRQSLGSLGLILGLSVVLHGWEARGASGPAFTALVPRAGEVVIAREGEEYLRFGLGAWGPNWAWVGVEGQTRSENGVATARLAARINGVPLDLAFQAARPSPDTLQLAYRLTASTNTALTLFMAELLPGHAFENSEVVVESAGRKTSAHCPFGKGVLGERVSALTLKDRSGQTVHLRFEPPCPIATDRAARLVLAQDRIQAAQPSLLTVTVALPGPTAWFADVSEVPDEPGLDSWYRWQATGLAGDSVLSLADWLEKPAGKHGRIRREGEFLIYNGKPSKLWGLNLCYSACAPQKDLADRRASFYPRYGINAVRLHKFADGAGWDGIQLKESAADYDPAGLDRMDYQVAKFKEAGIYVALSAHFGTIKMGPADERDVPFLAEFGTFARDRNRVSAPHSAFFYSPELQALHIRQTVNLLGHRNPYTGLTYAEDPAVCALEIINEQSVFFYTSMDPLKKSPTLRRQVGERFSDWLKAKYGSHAGLTRAWGERALNGFEKDGFPAGEQLEQRNILPLGNPWYWDPLQLKGSQAYRKQRFLDTLRFLYELQAAAYARYVKAVRAAGYEGEILGSNWQAGRALSHFANLHTDYQVGLIDRHNYFGGGDRGGAFNGGSMLARPGSGLLSSGLQQVADRPFMLSEWIHVFPNEWGVEGPAIVGAYGFGLQGWDASFMFQNGDDARFSEQLGRQAWDVMAPHILGVFPAVARQVLRGDVAESEVVAPRRVHMPSLFEGRLGFEDKIVQGYDEKELDGSNVPAGTLAALRCTVEFTEGWQETPAFDLRPFLQEGAIVSSTKQLRWTGSADAGTAGFFTMDTRGTKAVVGFAQGRECRLGKVTITPQSRFAAIYVTSPDQHGTVATSPRLLVVALARARNTGMKFSLTGDELLQRGKSPILMEPIRATISLSGRKVATVRLLDHDGRRTDRFRPVVDGTFTLDGAADQTPYYELTLE